METAIIGFIVGSFVVGAAWYLSRIIMRAEVIDMINEQTYEYIKDMEFKLSYLEKKNYILKKERNIAISDAKNTLDERDEAMRMLTESITNGT